jgi:polyhydroxyalkanoate synthesis regulator phasin
MAVDYSRIAPWLSNVLLDIKKDIKSEYLSARPSFLKLHFGNRPVAKITLEELVQPFEKELLNGNEELSEWVVNRWVMRHAEVYRHFALALSAINPNFEEIDQLTTEQGASLLKSSNELFGPVETLLFIVLNGVVISPPQLEAFREQALQEGIQSKQEGLPKEDSLSAILEKHQNELSRLTEKYENRLSGMTRKYATDTEALKNQIRSLQKQLHAVR